MALDALSESEIIGREIKFDDIRNIKYVYQPGILNQASLFNSEILGKAIKDLVGYCSKEDIEVYFNDVKGTIKRREPKNNEKWYEVFQAFNERLSKDFPAGKKLEYDYSKDRPSLPNFIEEDKPYQARMELFDNSFQGGLQAFACFVSGGVRLDSWSTNYGTIKPGQGFFHHNHTSWKGKPEVFVDSARRLSRALQNMGWGEPFRKDYNIEVTGDVRIIAPTGNALASRLVDSNSLTLFLNGASVKSMTQSYQKRIKNLQTMMG